VQEIFNEIMVNRKSFSKILQRAKRKVSKFNKDQIVVYCTPVEYIVLCQHFECECDFDPWELGRLNFFKERVKNGICNPSWHYFPIKYFSGLDLDSLKHYYQK
jgi:hypothetical protein